MRLADAEPKELPEQDPIKPVGGGYVPRPVKFANADFTEHCFTVGCKGCEGIQSGIGYSRAHDPDCRARLTEAIRATEGGEERVGRAVKRRTNWEGEDADDAGNDDA